MTSLLDLTIILLIIATVTGICWGTILIKRKSVKFLQVRFSSQIKTLQEKVELINKAVEKLIELVVKIVLMLVLIGGGIFALMKVVDFISSDGWTLMVCESKMGNGVDCQDTSYEIPGFKSAKECMLEGATRFSKQGFECGKDCKNEHGIINVCDEICNASGCS